MTQGDKDNFKVVNDLIAQAEVFEMDDPVPNLKVRPDRSTVSDFDARMSSYPCNDMGMAYRLLQRFGRDLMNIEEMGWLTWTGTHWSHPDGETKAMQLGHKTVYALRSEVRAVAADGPYDGEDAESFEKRIRAWKVFIRRSGDAPRVQGMMTSVVPYIRQKVDLLDAADHLFNTAAGTLDLESDRQDRSLPRVTVNPHERSDLLTRMSPVAYDPTACCPNFEQFMCDILPDREVRLFVQQWLGYALSGYITEQFVVMFYGGGSNGKSTLMDLIGAVLGDYALSLPFTSLLKDEKKRGGEATPDLARLPGARFVMASEPEQGAQFSESMLKSLTGGEKMTVRHLNKGFFEFRPQFKLILSFNNRPRIRGQDDGIWRRVLLVPFEQRYVEAHELAANPGAKVKDKALKQRLMAELPGILNWLIDGYNIWHERGLLIPDAVRAATTEYRSESNPVGEFLGDWTERRPGCGMLSSSELYGAYKKWCSLNEHHVWSMKAFGEGLTKGGLERQKYNGLIFYKDVMLTEEARRSVAPAAFGEGDTS